MQLCILVVFNKLVSEFFLFFVGFENAMLFAILHICPSNLFYISFLHPAVDLDYVDYE